MLIGIILMAVSVGLFIFVKKSRFERTNEAGVQVFDSFWQMLMIRFGDKLGMFVSVILFFMGLVYLLGIVGKK